MELPRMKFDICFSQDEIQLTLTENLKLPEGRLSPLESPLDPSAADPFPQIEALAQQFL